MSAQFYSLSWNSHNEKFRNGFSCFQQRQEFVDMTLVAEGHLVKVHKSVVALVSPYLKEIISSVPCEHPIIFLTNISHEILAHIIEYIYTGEVQVALKNLNCFLKAASQLNLLGINELSSLQGSLQKSTVQNNVNAGPTIQPSETVTFKIPDMVSENTGLCANHPTQEATEEYSFHNNGNMNEVDVLEHTLNVDTNLTAVNTPSNVIASHEINEKPDIKASIKVNTDYKHQYSISNRGSLQLILNRYIYLMHHQSNRGFKRRWRCLEYRRKKCKAYIDTEGDIITKRLNPHNHNFHDEKICKKSRQNRIYSSINSIEIEKHEDKKMNDKTEEMEDSS